jgi:ribosomal protein S18 acetylase RimI-like enzyme
VSVRPRGSDLMQIRRAEAADEEALASIRRRAILALAVPAMSREQAERWAMRGAADRVAWAMREHDVWVAVEGAAIGWVEVDRYRVAALYVSPSCSRRGVGSLLLTFAETSIRNSGYTTARLESSQNALDFYLRRGYLRCGPADSDGAWPLRKDLAAGGPADSDGAWPLRKDLAAVTPNS